MSSKKKLKVKNRWSLQQNHGFFLFQKSKTKLLQKKNGNEPTTINNKIVIVKSFTSTNFDFNPIYIVLII